MLDHSIVEIAKALFMKFGVKSISMDDICREAGISKKTIYSRVNNKADLINLVVSDHIQQEEEFIKEITSNSYDAIDEMIKMTEHVLPFLRNIKPSLAYDLRKYYNDSWQLVEKRHYTFIQENIERNIKRGQAEGIYRTEIRPDIISRLYLESSKLMVDEDVFPLRKYKKDRLYTQFIEYHMFGILNESGLEKYMLYKKRRNELEIA